MREKRPNCSVYLLICVVLGWAGATRAWAQYVPIFGGPASDFSILHGYQEPSLLIDPGSSAASGIGVGYARRFEGSDDLGNRAVYWDAFGTAIELDNLWSSNSGTVSSRAFAVNNSGVAVGFTQKFEAGSARGNRAIRWGASGSATELGNLGTSSGGSTRVEAYAVNEAGTAVGTASKYDAGVMLGTRAVRWDASGAAIELGIFGTNGNGFSSADALAINNAGLAVGRVVLYDAGISKGSRAVRWNASDTTATELGNIGLDSNGFTSVAAHSVNENGTAVGKGQKHIGGVYKGDRAIRWDGSGTAATELGDLGLTNSGSTDAQAIAVNSAGAAVGYSWKYISGVSHGIRPVRWDDSGVALELGLLGTNSSGRTSGAAHSINDEGFAVGNVGAHDALGQYLGMKAVLWTPDGAAVDINTLVDPASGWSNLIYAADITNDGWITGMGTFDPPSAGLSDSYERLFLIQVPEPACVYPLCFGMMALLACKRTVRFPLTD